LLAIAALSLGRGVRFAIYLAPFVGMGLGALVEVAVRGFLGRSKNSGRPDGDGHEEVRIAAIDTNSRLLVATATYAAVLAVFFVQLKPMTRMGHVGRPAIPAETVAVFRDLGRQLPPGTPIWTWWDYGYAIPHIASLAAYHDGGGQATPQTNVIANSLVISDQAALRNTILFVDRLGNKGIEGVARAVSSREALLEQIGHYAGLRDGESDVYVLFTARMVEIFETLRYVAGLPLKNARGEALQYEVLPCRKLRAEVLECNGFDIDLSSGAFSDGRAVGRLVVVADGRVVRTTDFPQDSGFVLQVLTDPQGRIDVLRLPEEIYRSNLNRMFLLGEYDATLFDEVYRKYPVARVFRVRR
jgi:dolichyl-diphosphooligosaccharide--protein glycosyltransferase